MVITFGKYKDQDISEIPGDYLAWRSRKASEARSSPRPSRPS